MGFHISNEDPDEPLKGKPRAVRLEKVDYPFARAIASLTIEMDYDRSARIIDRRVYRPDGTLSFHEAFQYEADPRVHTVQVLSTQGEVLSTRKIVAHPDGEESAVSSASGEITERTTTHRDSDGRVIEAVSEDTVRGHEIRMRVVYREGRAEAHVTFSQDPRRDHDLVAGTEEGSITYRDASGHAHEHRAAAKRTIVQSRDIEGNWTRKVVVERDPSSGEEIVLASIDRTITYYSE